MSISVFPERTDFRVLRDPRILQIASLTALLTVGMTLLGFDQNAAAIPLIVLTALAAQFALTRIFDLPAFDPVSPLITVLSLSILLRAPDTGWLMLAAFLAMASKFLIRIDGQHVFNPANFGISLVLLMGQGWISPAQWGSQTFFAFLFACLATLVLSRARRSDIALAFLVTYIAILFGRAAWLGDPWAIPLKQMQSGGLLLFAFFMISDPKTTPKNRLHRIGYAILVAAFAGYLQFARYMPECLMFALFFASPLVPLLNRLDARTRAKPLYDWTKPTH